MKNIKSNAKGLAIAFIGAIFAYHLKLPLPWLLGPLLAVLISGTAGYSVSCMRTSHYWHHFRLIFYS